MYLYIPLTVVSTWLFKQLVLFAFSQLEILDAFVAVPVSVYEEDRSNSIKNHLCHHGRHLPYKRRLGDRVY